MQIRPHKFRGENGVLYTAHLYNNDDYLLSYDTPDGTYYLVVWRLIPLKFDTFAWGRAFPFWDDFLKAYQFLKRRNQDRKGLKTTETEAAI